MGIKELIEKYKLSKNPTPNELKDFIVATAKDVISLKFLEVKDDLQKQLEKIKDNVESRISETLSRTYKGDKGDKPIAGIDYQIPKDGYTPIKGKDYFDGKNADEERIIREVIKQMPIPKNGSPDTPNRIIEKINMAENKIKIGTVKGLEEWLRDIMRAVREKTTPKQISGGGDVIQYYDLTPQCNGVSKIFTIPTNRRVLGVFGTQFPISFRPLIDWTSTRTILTLTDQVSAPETGQTLYILYVKA